MSRTHLVTPQLWLSRGEAAVPGEHSQLAVFGGIVGEEATVMVFSHNQHQARARVTHVDRPHPHRVQPACPKWGPCGLCPWMHLDDHGRLEAFSGLLGDALRAEGVTAQPRPTHLAPGNDQVLAIDLIVGRSDRGQIRMGVPPRDSPGIVAIPECIKVDPLIRAAMPAIMGAMDAAEVWPWDGRQGTLSGVGFRKVPGTDALLVLLDVKRTSHSIGKFAECLVSMQPSIRGVVVRHEEEVRRAVGVDTLEGTWAGMRVPYHVLDLWPQTMLAEAFEQALVEDLDVKPGDAVVDVCGGRRARTALLARASGWALGIEVGDEEVLRGREIATLNRIPAEFGFMEEALQAATPRLQGRRPLVHVELGHRNLTDELRRALVGFSPRRVALSSDNPRAFAREVGLWARKGWEVRSIDSWEVLPWSPLGALRAVLVSPDRSEPALRAPRRKTIRG